MISKTTYIICAIFLFCTAFFYYPKYNKPGSEATIGWDVSGYYWYLPTFFIYKDVRNMSFTPEVMKKYSPTPDIQQYAKNRNGAYIMKYSMGLALLFSPFFFMAHILAEPLGYPADGFSLPYQFAIHVGSFLMALLGLYFLRKVLLKYFKDNVVAFVLGAYVFGSNYLNYASIDLAMTHNWLFTTYAILLYITIIFYEKPSLKKAIAIGALVGINALVRPTDIISVIIPLLWGINNITLADLKNRMSFFWQHKNYMLAAIITAGLIGFLQLAYYRYAGDEWLIYSYKEETFHWLSPHFKDYMFSFRCGWLLYNPLFILAIIGLFFIKKRNIGWIAIILFVVLNTYIVTSWQTWWYGARAMIQSYPVLAFPLAVTIDNMQKKTWSKYLLLAFLALCIHQNIWWTHGVHRGGYYDGFDATKSLFYRSLGKWKRNPEFYKLYDTNELFEGNKKDIALEYSNNFDSDSTLIANSKKLNGSITEFVNAQRQFTNIFEFSLRDKNKQWVRVRNSFHCLKKESNVWKMVQVVVKFIKDGKEIKGRMYKPQRNMVEGQISSNFFDVKTPTEPFDKVQVFFWNADGAGEMLIDNLIVESFNEK